MGHHPVFGEITALSDGVMMIKVEIPEFIQERMEERGIEIPMDIPDTVELSIADKARFFQDGNPADSMPFSVGDRVAVIAGMGAFGEPQAWMISDYATARQRMQDRPMDRPERRNPPPRRRDN
jgi:hypothetical protein